MRHARTRRWFAKGLIDRSAVPERDEARAVSKSAGRIRAWTAARLLLGLLLLTLRAVDVPAAWDGFCRADHRFHLTTAYLLWKHLGVEVDAQVVYAGLWRDGGHRDLVRGKTREELRVLFPELKTSGALTREQAWYDSSMRSRWAHEARDRGACDELLWLGDTTWGVEMRDGRAVDLGVWKG